MINIKKQYQPTTGLIQRIINDTHLLSIGVILAGEILFEKMFQKVCSIVIHNYAWKTISCKTEKGNRVIQSNFVWMMLQVTSGQSFRKK